MKREENYGWLYGIVAGSCVAAMQIGVGMFQMDRDYAILLGAAQGLLVCSLTVICGGILVWILKPLPTEREEQSHPVQQRLTEYREAFHNLAVSFAGAPGRMAEAVPEEERLDKTEKMKLLWNTRLEENRAAVAVQLNEMARIMTDTVEYAWDTQPDEDLEQRLAKKLRSMGLSVHSVMVYQEEHRRQEVYLTISTRHRKCVATKDIAEALSRLMKKAMMPGKDSRAFVGSEKATVPVRGAGRIFRCFTAWRRRSRAKKPSPGTIFPCTGAGKGSLSGRCRTVWGPVWRPTGTVRWSLTCWSSFWRRVSPRRRRCG